MATEDRVKVLEGEFKLIKSELRQTLASVRDFLLDLKVPPMQEEPGTLKEETNTHDNGAETVPPEQNRPFGNGDNGFGGDGYQPPQNQMPDFSGMDQSPQGQTAPNQQPAAEEATAEALPPLDFDDSEDNEMSSGDIPGLQSEKKNNTVEDDDCHYGDAEKEEDEDEREEVIKGKGVQSRPAAPQINLLANLIRWVSMAKKEIGSAQITVFLDVYATTGSLSSEVKAIILHLAEVATNPTLADEIPENGQVINEQLKLCMEINRSSGQLPDDIKLKIQRLTELLLQQSIYYNKADVWSTLLVDLHGILSGGGSGLLSLQPVNPAEIIPSEAFDDDSIDDEVKTDNFDLDLENDETSANERIIYHEPAKTDPNMLKGTRPARLRLILPAEDGKEQELDLGNLFIATDNKLKPNNGHKKSVSVRK